MGKLNNFAGLFALGTLCLVAYAMFSNKEDNEGKFLGYSKRRR